MHSAPAEDPPQTTTWEPPRETPPPKSPPPCLLGFGPADPDHDPSQAILFADTAEAAERPEQHSNQADSPLENERARERGWRPRKAALQAGLAMEAQILHYQDLYVKKKEGCLN